jgi:hypothetical protein
MAGDSGHSRADGTLAGSSDMKELYLDQLDKKAGNGPGSERRRHARIPHRLHDGIEAILTDPDGHETVCRVRPRNVSQGGIAFLHEKFLLPDTRCTIMLISNTDQLVEISGDVVDCRHVEGRLHEIAIAFDQPITPSDFQDCVGD